ncbi:hypothetical protein HG537_0F02400 [Torulaspora globosa]|uniref:Uncharacterized protein n=1 Tax=Torulaspora globosa TaxID=48254 RepID=A0A7H9HW20_9SACH|nr:hypothetical protein HG537_0F02400 [Torulaspora sp. CBS 2947]
MSEPYSDNMNRFNNIIDDLPLRLRLTLSSLSLLDNVSTQLLRLLILNSNSPQVIAVLTDPTGYLSSGDTEIFRTLLKLFEQIRMIYINGSALIGVEDVAPGLWFSHSPPPLLLKGHEAYVMTAIRKANLLTFLLAVLGCFNYGFEFLQQTFLDIFCPNIMFNEQGSIDTNGKFLKKQSILYLDLKTQAFIAGLKDFDISSDEIPQTKQQELLRLIFADDLADQLVSRRMGTYVGDSEQLMTSSEREFMERCERRRENLSQYTSYKNLTQDYDWAHFVKELLDYSHKNLGLIIWGKKGRGKSPLYSYEDSDFDPNTLYASGSTTTDENPSAITSSTHQLVDPQAATFDAAELSMAAQQTMLAQAPTKLGDQDQFVKSIENTGADAIGAANLVKKLKPKRTWTKAEEDALVQGLKEVGPSWSKILDLYGPGGKISEALKNRTQVQLKDKARNWKLAYLKTGRTLPNYLFKVTGTLERTYRNKKKPVQEQAFTQDGEPSSASELFRSGTTDSSGFDPSLDTDI